MKLRLKLCTALTMCLCALPMWGSAAADDPGLPESIANYSPADAISADDAATPADLALKAHGHQTDTFVVTFDTDGGTNVPAQTVISGETADQPPAPTKEGYHFEGWFRVTDGVVSDEVFGFLEPVTGDITLRARWGRSYTITLLPGEGMGEAVVISSEDEENWAEAIHDGKFFSNDDGVHFTCPGQPEGFTAPEGLSFQGWRVDGESTLYTVHMPLVGLTKPAYTLTAQWARYYPIAWADMTDAVWAPTRVAEAAEGETVTAIVYLNQTAYDAGSRLLALKITGADAEPKWVSRDITGRSLGAVIPIPAGNGTVVYVANFTMPAGDVTVTALIGRPFGAPDFILPEDITRVEASAFKGAAMTVVCIPDGCESIGDYAFRDCLSLTQIRVPAGCALGEDVFSGCGTVYVFGTAGSPAEAWCAAHDNCMFVAE